MAALFWMWLLANPPAEPDAVKDSARAILANRCGKCHDGSLDTAKPAALKIFDLRDADFETRLSDERLAKLVARMDSFGAPAEEKERMQAFVDKERRRRR